MPMLKFRCKTCDVVFEELVSAARMAEVVCEACGSGEVARAYEGKCLFGMAGSSAGRGCNCSGNCSGCSGCGHDHGESGGCGCCAH